MTIRPVAVWAVVVVQNGRDYNGAFSGIDRTAYKHLRSIVTIAYMCKQVPPVLSAAISQRLETQTISLMTRAQRPIEPSNTVHVLPILCLLLLAYAINIVPRYLCILRSPEPRKAHHLPHHRFFRVLLRLRAISINLHLVRVVACFWICRWFRGGLGWYCLHVFVAVDGLGIIFWLLSARSARRRASAGACTCAVSSG